MSVEIVLIFIKICRKYTSLWDLIIKCFLELVIYIFWRLKVSDRLWAKNTEIKVQKYQNILFQILV